MLQLRHRIGRCLRDDEMWDQAFWRGALVGVILVYVDVIALVIWLARHIG